MRPERYIIQTKSHYEREACRRLGLRGMKAVAPHTRRFERKEGKRVVLRSQPVLPGYLFAKAAPEQLEVLREVDGISPRPLMADGKVRAMKPAERAYIGKMVRRPPPDPRDPNPYGKPDPDAPPFQAGQSVKVLDGPFASFRGVVEAVRIAGKKWKVKAEVLIFGRRTPVDFDAGALAPA